MASARIRWHLNRLEKRGVTSNERLMRWRLIVRAGQEEYDRELDQLDSLNSIKADPSMALEIVE